MAEQRKFTSSILISPCNAKSIKIELFPAEQWQGGTEGCFRLRINRKWHKLSTQKGNSYLDTIQISQLVLSLSTGHPPKERPVPSICSQLTRHTRILVPNGKVLLGMVLRDQTWPSTSPIRAYDGEWYIGTHLYDRGQVFVNVNDLVIIKAPGV